MNEISLDTNILLYVIDVESEFYKRSRSLLEKLEEKNIGVVVTWQNLAEFYATVTDKKRHARPLTCEQAIKEIRNIVNSESVRLILPNSKTGNVWLELLVKTGIKGQKIHDLSLAATLLSNGVKTLVTENISDFKGVNDLKVLTLDGAISDINK